MCCKWGTGVLRYRRLTLLPLVASRQEKPRPLDLGALGKYYPFLRLLLWEEGWEATPSCQESRIFKEQKTSRDRTCGFRQGVVKTLECGDQYEMLSSGNVGSVLNFQNRGNTC